MLFDPLVSYSAGLRGCEANPRSDEELVDHIIRHGGDPDGGHVASEWEFAGRGQGKLTMLSPVVEKVFPSAFPGPAQLTGDCVARAAANCLLVSIALEIADERPDEVSGLVEGAPELPELGVRQGVVAAESIWAWRGYDRDGWICSKAAKVANEQGFLVRKAYPSLKVDLTKYTDQTIRLGGSRAPSQAWLDESSKHVARTVTFVQGREQVRDFLAAGYGVFNCSSMGFERTRNEDGVSRQIGVWHHAQIFHSYDDRPETIQKYGQALVGWQNSWGAWNSGPRRVRGTDIDIPVGGYWALANTIDKCQCIALSSVAGWPRRQHTTYGAAGNI
jgi:hypothetical protein